MNVERKPKRQTFSLTLFKALSDWEYPYQAYKVIPAVTPKLQSKCSPPTFIKSALMVIVVIHFSTNGYNITYLVITSEKWVIFLYSVRYVGLCVRVLLVEKRQGPLTRYFIQLKYTLQNISELQSQALFEHKTGRWNGLLNSGPFISMCGI